MAKGKTTHVTPHKGGGWQVKTGGSKKAAKVTETKAEAVEVGRDISKNQGTEFVIHGKDGKIQSKDSHGNDPSSSKG